MFLLFSPKCLSISCIDNVFCCFHQSSCICLTFFNVFFCFHQSAYLYLILLMFFFFLFCFHKSACLYLTLLMFFLFSPKCLLISCIDNAFCFFSKCLYMSCHLTLYALQTGIPYITDCVMAELEKLGRKYRIALKYVTVVPFCEKT